MPGASTVVRGGVVAYASEVKADVLGVDRELLAREGAVCEPVAAAAGRRHPARCWAAPWAVDDRVWPAPTRPTGSRSAPCSWRQRARGESSSSELALTGDREQIRAASVLAVLSLLDRALENLRDGVGPSGYR